MRRNVLLQTLIDDIQRNQKFPKLDALGLQFTVQQLGFLADVARGLADAYERGDVTADELAAPDAVVEIVQHKEIWGVRQQPLSVASAAYVIAYLEEVCCIKRR